MRINNKIIKMKNNNPKPAKYYPNSDLHKSTILSNNKNKAGIYMWKNLINGKQYIGSAKDLRIRLSKNP